MLVAATGGVAAEKTPALLRRLREAGFAVRAAATDDAYRFVTPLALAVAAGGEVFDRDAWFRADGEARHLSWARWAELLLVAPASADALASAALGRADDVVSALLLAGARPALFAPAMNTAMWEAPALRRNVERLRADGHGFVGPASGPLAALGEGSGVGRMSEPEEIVVRVQRALAPQDYRGRRVLVSAGPTREYLDPVRFLSNPSSGRMGFAVAEAALARGAEVTLVAGPTEAPAPPGARLQRVTSAEEMRAAIDAEFDSCDLLVMTAAVADWRPAETAAEKTPKQGDATTLKLVRTADILEGVAARKRHQVTVGFAMETDRGVERALEKARRKRLDFICLNYPTREHSAFGGDHNEVTVVDAAGRAEALPRMPKRALADRILDRALPRLASG